MERLVEMLEFYSCVVGVILTSFFALDGSGS